MAKVKTFELLLVRDARLGCIPGVPDQAIAEFITECEEEFYVNVGMFYVPLPTPRITVVVTKVDTKDPVEVEKARALAGNNSALGY